ncbi:Gfo/Idh/MocA family oxidoreductase [Opitutus sp. ER46]|uniref:Gfo/Idh/MocA family protein n=1 Tax=Opitutus sp. ER46 TaxID=2161864 RepID=UPI000D30F29B|nr:Gfo/Idh/MocA family oxidoreductase [Opitutus sp. ER46]PTX97902.1 gfo/Idh/MocA family oxidoreductase [Opitutus sp. ER46]
MNTRQLRWGVLGYARIARVSVIPAIRKSRNAVFHALASRDGAKLDQCRAEGAPPHCHASYEDLVHDPEVEAVYIPLPNSMHREWTLQAIAQGKHVLCEKPMGLSAAESREMIAAAEARGVTLMEAFMYRYTPRTQKVVEILRSGVLGEIKQVNAFFRFRLQAPSIKLHPELGGGSLYDVGCYPINFIGLVVDILAGGGPAAGGQPEKVAVDCVCEGGVDMNFSALLHYRSGLMATLQSGFSAHRRIYAEIIGTEGTLEVPDAFLGDGSPLVLLQGDSRRELSLPTCDRYQLEIEDFSDAVMQGRAPAFRLVETVRNAELLDRLLAASRA